MKTIFILLIFLTLQLHSQTPSAAPIKLPVDGQPDSLGLCLNQSGNVYRYGTLFEETNTYFFSCGHDNFYPRQGEDIVFGNGKKKKVAEIWIVGTIRGSNTFDLVIGRLDSPLNNIPPSQAWWHLPKSFNTEKTLTGFALDGLYTGIGDFRRQDDYSTDYIQNEVSGVIVRGGYSGSPIWHKGKVIGPTIGTGDGTISTVTPLFMALIKKQELFPAFFQSPNSETKLLISDIDNKTKSLVMELAPGNDFKVGSSMNLTSWFDSNLMGEFQQRDDISVPWKRYYTFDTTYQKSMFFRGERIK
jgi:hypothetical protein